MDVILNIGLHSDKLGKIAPVTAISAVRLAWLQIKSSTVVQSDTEPTLVLTVSDEIIGFDNRIAMLSVALGQDCIAVWHAEEGYGDLLGPKAAEWGPFNPEFFILPDGTRLAEPAAKAA